MAGSMGDGFTQRAEVALSGRIMGMGAALKSLNAGIAEDFLLETHDRPLAVRRRLQASVARTDLLLDSIRLLFSQLASRSGDWVLFLDPEFRYKLQLFSWPPGSENEPHLHTNWNVSAVLSGSLLVYRSALSETDCRAAEPLRVNAGEVGVLIPPQFHCLRNDGVDTALTFHVFSVSGPDEGAHLERQNEAGVRFDDAEIVAIGDAAVRHAGAQAKDILRTAYLLVGHDAKLYVVKQMVKVDPMEAVRMGKSLAELVGGRDGERLFAVIEKIETAAGLRS